MYIYSKEFYNIQKTGSRKSAQEIIPIILEYANPKSVIDVGCGIGSWLSLFKECGINDYIGIDGEYIDINMLEIPKEKFIPMDLNKPIKLNRKFDLVMSLEVAEHLPKECAEQFVESLVRLGDIIVFSAAIPFQRGTNHINEQWQEYWEVLFNSKDYIAVDCIRGKIWNNKNVSWWYSQNIILYIKEYAIQDYPLLKKEFANLEQQKISIVHPKLFEWLMTTKI